MPMTTISHLTCEYQSNLLGIDVLQPRLSWQLQSDRRGARQTAYRILAASDVEQLRAGNANAWDSGRIESDQSIHIPYMGKELVSHQRVHWKVIVWDESDQSAESEPAWFEMGLLNRSDWKAQWIAAP